jgi:hypothetical protein
MSAIRFRDPYTKSRNFIDRSIDGPRSLGGLDSLGRLNWWRINYLEDRLHEEVVLVLVRILDRILGRTGASYLARKVLAVVQVGLEVRLVLLVVHYSGTALAWDLLRVLFREEK